MDQVKKLAFWVIVVVVMGLITPVGVRAFWVVDEQGRVVQEGEVLGRDDQGDKKEEETRTEVRSGGVKVRLERKDGEMKLKAEREDGEEEELGNQEILKIRDRVDKNEIEVEAGEKEGEFVLRRGQVEANTRFPLSVNLETNELVVTTPAGERGVTGLPDQAVQNMLAANVIDRLVSATTSGVILGERRGVPVYEIPGVKQRKLLGFIPVQIEQTAVVSAETGELVATEDVSLAERVISLLSID